MIKKALIIAAGLGSRLRNSKNDLPKPLQRVAGLPLIQRIILTAKEAGISEFVIVVGYKKDLLIQSIEKLKLGVTLTFVENPDWEKSNGVSVLSAKPYLTENFVLLMSDHIFEAATLKRFCIAGLNGNQVNLAVDYKLKTIFDMDDATKVLESNGKILEIGKSLTTYNAIDTGMFLASPDLFTALESVKKDGNCSLSDGIQKISSQKLMGTYDIGEAFWQDVDTPETVEYAENYLLKKCRKPTDGIISRNFNRYISLFFTKFLIKTNLSANHLTAITSLVGLFSGIFAARGDYLGSFVGAFLFKMSSILDGCDGEMSKLKLTSSKMGQWLDTASDNATYVIFMVGVIIGLSKQNYPNLAILAPLTIFGLVMTLSVMFFYLIRHTHSGSLLAVESDFKKSPENSKIKNFFLPLRYLVKRDFFALAFFVMGAFGRLDLILWGYLLGTNAMWMVLGKTLLFRK